MSERMSESRKTRLVRGGAGGEERRVRENSTCEGLVTMFKGIWAESL